MSRLSYYLAKKNRSFAIFELVNQVEALTAELAAAKKDAIGARSNLAWIVENITTPARKPDAEELELLAKYDAAQPTEQK